MKLLVISFILKEKIIFTQKPEVETFAAIAIVASVANVVIVAKLSILDACRGHGYDSENISQ